MGLIGSILSNIGDFFSNFFGGRSSGGDVEIDTSIIDELKDRLLADIDKQESEFEATAYQTMDYGGIADNKYMELIENNLTSVPAVDMYDGDYVSRVDEVITEAQTGYDDLRTQIEEAYATAMERAELMAQEMEATGAMASEFGGMNTDTTIYPDTTELEMIEPQISSTTETAKEELIAPATEIQTFLREPTSEARAAEIWEAKFVKGAVEHIPPHYPGVKYATGDPMSEVMRAYRMYAETNAYQLTSFGSQTAINAMYEAYMEGQDPYAYIDRIMGLIAGDSEDGSDYNIYSNVFVPGSDGFGGSFLF